MFILIKIVYLMNMTSMILLFILINLIFDYLMIYSPMKYLLYFMMFSFSIFFSMMSFYYNNFILFKLLMCLIIFISGIMIVFSYFISLLNSSMMKINKFNYSMNLLLWSLCFMMTYKNYYMLKIYLFNYYFKFNFNDELILINEFKLFYNNLEMIIFMFIYLFIILFLSMKICSINKKSLRMKKMYFDK